MIVSGFMNRISLFPFIYFALSPVHKTKSSLSTHSFDIHSSVCSAKAIGASHASPGEPHLPAEGAEEECVVTL